MIDEDLAEALAEQAVLVEYRPASDGSNSCCGIKYSEEYVLCIFGYPFQSFGSKEGSERARHLFKERVTQQIIQMLANTG
jgi:hypothetical protein